MQQDSLDHTIFLRQLGHVDQVLIRVSLITLDEVVHPLRGGSGISLEGVLLEELNFASRDSDDHNAHSNILGKIGGHSPPEIVSWAQASSAPAQGRHGRI